MKGWLIYDREGADRNRAFIDFWFLAARDRGISIELCITDSPFSDETPDFAVVRTMNPALSYALEAKGIPVFNAAFISDVCNNKWKTYCLAKSIDVPTPNTEYIPDPAYMPSRSFPFVLKACEGHGGTQVFMVTNEQELAVAQKALSGIPSVIQEPVSELGKDLRIYVLGNRV